MVPVIFPESTLTSHYVSHLILAGKNRDIGLGMSIAPLTSLFITCPGISPEKSFPNS